MLERLWLTVLPVFWRVALLPAAIAWTPPAECGAAWCAAVDVGLNLTVLAPFAAIAYWEGTGLAGLGLGRAGLVRGLVVGAVAAVAVAGAWILRTGPFLLLGPESSIPGPGAAARLAVAAVLEECAYRGFVQRRLMADYGRLLGTVGAAALFALGHVAALAIVYQPEGTAALGPLAYFFVAGCILGAFFAVTASIWASALPHAVFNILGAATTF